MESLENRLRSQHLGRGWSFRWADPISVCMVCAQSESAACSNPIRSRRLGCSGMPHGSCRIVYIHCRCPSHYSSPDPPDHNLSLRSHNDLLQMHRPFHRQPGSKRRRQQPPQREFSVSGPSSHLTGSSLWCKSRLVKPIRSISPR
jgi:hypothetical protein